MTRPPRILDPIPANVARSQRFVERRRAWRAAGVRYHARHAALEPYAPAILAAMFDRAVRVVSPAREYAYRLTDTGQTVRLNVDNWHWHCLDGTADGRGLYELWAWRWDIPVEDAHAELWATINRAFEAPGLARAA